MLANAFLGKREINPQRQVITTRPQNHGCLMNTLYGKSNMKGRPKGAVVCHSCMHLSTCIPYAGDGRRCDAVPENQDALNWAPATDLLRVPEYRHKQSHALSTIRRALWSSGYDCRCRLCYHYLSSLSLIRQYPPQHNPCLIHGRANFFWHFWWSDMLLLTHYRSVTYLEVSSL
jgi:hypothetical protein